MKKYVKKLMLLFLTVALALPSFGCQSVMLNADESHKLVINEVVLSNSRSLYDEKFGTPDWVELYNSGDTAISLEGYGLTDNFKDPHKWTFPDITLEPGGYIVVYATKKSADETDLCTGYGLSRNGETLLLTDKYYNVLEQLDVPALDTDVSYARTTDGSYGYCASPTPNAENSTDIAGSPDEMTYSENSSDLSISEVVPNNTFTLASADGSCYPFAELYNSSELPVLLSGYYLSDDPGNAMKWRMPDYTLNAGAYIIVFCSGGDGVIDGELHSSFKLGSSDDTLLLTDGGGTICSELTWDTTLPDDIAVVGSGLYCGTPTPMAENSGAVFDTVELTDMDSSDPIRLNEALPKNKYSITDEDGDRSPWIELVNTSNSPVSLLGYCLSDDANKPFKYPLPDVTLEAGGYIVVFASGKDKMGDSIHTSFRLSTDDGAVLLSNRNGLRVDAFTVDPALTDNVSIGRNESGAQCYYTSPTPGAANTSHAYDSADVILTDMNGVYISEVCSAVGLMSKSPDWIELHNASDSDIDLSGWRLTDDPDDPEQFIFSDFKIGGGDYAVINAGDGEGVYAPFSISDNETLLLYNASGELMDAFETGTLYDYGETSGRIAGDSAARRVYYLSSTKGAKNSGEYYDSRVLAPVFSDSSLYHTGSLEITVSCATQGAVIRYTLDGSAPTESSSLYSDAFTFTKNTVLRAAAFKDGLLQSEVVTSTYLFEEPHTVPVVCICADSADWSDVYGVTDRWKKITRTAYFEFYDTDGRLGVKFPCTIRANGASTLTYAQKSLAVALRGGYGTGSTNYQFFPGNDVSVYRGLVLRNSGQDYTKARLRDSFFSRAVEGMDLDNAWNRICVMYVNGRYWGLYDLTENQNEDYLAEHYGVDADEVNIIRRNETPLEGDRAEMYRVRAFARDKELSVDSVYQEFLQWVDEDCFIDYLVAQTYFANSDMFNQKYWRSGDYSVKWRPVFYDLDWGLSGSDPSRNMIHSYFNSAGVPSVDESLTNMDIFCGLRKNAGWCDKFCARYVYCVYNYFDPERLTGILDGLASEMRPEMQRHIDRWGKPSSVSAWESSVKALRECIEARQSYALKALQREFSLTDAQMNAYTQAAQAG